jgi:NTP pyrophosphatase (non-canonical NTP hydrolase)
LHTPKELAAAISIEAAELQEIFLWRSSDEEAPPDRHRLEDEIADILIFCLNFADVADIDVLRVIEQKIAINEERYPVTKRRG